MKISGRMLGEAEIQQSVPMSDNGVLFDVIVGAVVGWAIGFLLLFGMFGLVLFARRRKGRWHFKMRHVYRFH